MAWNAWGRYWGQLFGVDTAAGPTVNATPTTYTLTITNNNATGDLVLSPAITSINVSITFPSVFAEPSHTASPSYIPITITNYDATTTQSLNASGIHSLTITEPNTSLSYIFTGLTTNRNPRTYAPTGQSDRYRPVPESSQHLFQNITAELIGANLFIMSDYTVRTTQPGPDESVIKMVRIGTRNVLTPAETAALITAGYSVDVGEYRP